MSRIVLFLTMLPLVAVAACTTSTAGEDECTIAGTYSFTSAKESGDCPESSSSSSSTTLTVTPIDDTTYSVEFQGLTGACALSKVGACKLQGKCDLVVKDAVDPSNATGSLQYTWTFGKTGFTGFTSVTIPPAKSIPKGCSENSTSTGTLR